MSLIFVGHRRKLTKILCVDRRVSYLLILVPLNYQHKVVSFKNSVINESIILLLKCLKDKFIFNTNYYLKKHGL